MSYHTMKKIISILLICLLLCCTLFASAAAQGPIIRIVGVESTEAGPLRITYVRVNPASSQTITLLCTNTEGKILYLKEYEETAQGLLQLDIPLKEEEKTGVVRIQMGGSGISCPAAVDYDFAQPKPITYFGVFQTTTAGSLAQTVGQDSLVSLADAQGNALAGEALVGTGSVITLQTQQGSTYTLTSVIMGDVDKDNDINSLDALTVLLYNVGKNPLDAVQQFAADVDGTPSIDALDALTILQYSVGIVDAL